VSLHVRNASHHLFQYNNQTQGRSAFAEVALAGSVNGVPFEVTRKRGPRVNQLQFVLDGQDLSRQSARETQKAMEEALGLDLDFLGLAIFCGQHQMNGLLEATDVKLKERLSKVVRLEVWEGLKELAKARLKQGQEEVAAADTQVKVQELDLERQQREEAELLEALEREAAGSNKQQQGAVAAQQPPVRTLEMVEAELARAGQQLEAARSAWKAALERREQAARGRAEAGESAGARRERLRTLRLGFEEDARAVALLEDRWDPERYWADLQLFGLVAKDARPDLASQGLAFAAHVSNDAFAARLAAVEAARGEGLAEVGAAAAELKKVEAALASMTAGGKPGGAADGDESGGAGLEGGCPTCGRPWEEGADAEKAAEHLRGEAVKVQARLKEGQQRQLRLEKQRSGAWRCFG
jgi:DNA repair exonuclease SbcCD ATPase subunit